MAIFKKDKKEDSIDIKETIHAKKSVPSTSKAGEFEYVLTKPHITEKASMHAENNVYVFEVNKRANKAEVRSIVKELYKVEPIKINIVNLPAKRVLSRGIKGKKPGKKKALVYLKKGDTIEII